MPLATRMTGQFNAWSASDPRMSLRSSSESSDRARSARCPVACCLPLVLVLVTAPGRCNSLMLQRGTLVGLGCLTERAQAVGNRRSAAAREVAHDFDSLERWARSLPHQQWWQQFLRDRGGTGFWHETYFRGGQIESVYIDMPGTGLAKFAPVTPARGSLFSARRRLGMREGNEPPPGIPEEELYQQ
jgi:hypothetical protein